MTNRSAEETRAHYIDEMGEELGSVFYQLYVEVVWLRSKWSEHQELFGAKPERIDLLNAVAPYFFRIVQDALLHDTMLGIARLTDPTRMGRNENLSLQKLAELVDDSDLTETLRVALDSLNEAVAPVRDWRNRRIAHCDFPHSANPDANPLLPMSRESISSAITEIERIVNLVSHHYCNSTIVFELVTIAGGANKLLYVLHDGLQAENEREKRLADGDWKAALDGPRDL